MDRQDWSPMLAKGQFSLRKLLLTVTLFALVFAGAAIGAKRAHDHLETEPDSVLSILHLWFPDRIAQLGTLYVLLGALLGAVVPLALVAVAHVFARLAATRSRMRRHAVNSYLRLQDALDAAKEERGDHPSR